MSGIDRVGVDRLTICIGDERSHQFSGAGSAAPEELVRQAEEGTSRR